MDPYGRGREKYRLCGDSFENEKFIGHPPICISPNALVKNQWEPFL